MRRFWNRLFQFLFPDSKSELETGTINLRRSELSSLSDD
jgi:hypothetical protein